MSQPAYQVYGIGNTETGTGNLTGFSRARLLRWIATAQRAKILTGKYWIPFATIKPIF